MTCWRRSEHHWIVQTKKCNTQFNNSVEIETERASVERKFWRVYFIWGMSSGACFSKNPVTQRARNHILKSVSRKVRCVLTFCVFSW